MELLTADYTFLNDRLASHYGISGVTGPQFRKVTLTDKARFGLLGKAAVQLRTSYGDRTSPVLRGAWVLDKLMGTPPTPPPPDTATDLSQKAGEQPKTVRARLSSIATRRRRMCHGVIDPTGLALENFDAIGQWRTRDSEANVPIDASTVLPTGVAINGVVDLRATGRASGRVRANRDGEIADVRSQPTTGVFRYAAGSRHRSVGCERQLHAVVNRLGNRQQQRVPQAGCGRGEVRARTMFITKKHIPRRAVLKAAGVSLALPFLDAMVPAGTLAQTAAVPKLRTGFFYIPHGAIMGNTSHGPSLDKWTPSGSVPPSSSVRSWRRWSRTRRSVSSFGNLQNAATAGSVHSFTPATWLSATRPDTGAPRAHMATTLDQVIAKIIGQETPLPSLEVPRKPPCSRRPVAADTIPRCLSATRNRRCRWSRIREGLSPVVR